MQLLNFIQDLVRLPHQQSKPSSVAHHTISCGDALACQLLIQRGLGERDQSIVWDAFWLSTVLPFSRLLLDAPHHLNPPGLTTQRAHLGHRSEHLLGMYLLIVDPTYLEAVLAWRHTPLRKTLRWQPLRRLSAAVGPEIRASLGMNS